MLSSEQLQQSRSNYLKFLTNKLQEEIVYMTHPVYIKSLEPLKAYCLRYKFFQISETENSSSTDGNKTKVKVCPEGDMVQELIHQNKRLEIGSKFNRKVSETVQDVLEGL